MTDIRVLSSSELFMAPGPPRGFALTLPSGTLETAVFSLAFPSRPKGTKQSLWTIMHGVHTEGRSGGVEFPRHTTIIYWVTVQVADPQVTTPFTIETVTFV